MYARHLRNRIHKNISGLSILKDLLKAAETDPDYTDQARKRLVTLYGNQIKQIETLIATLTNLLETAYGEKL